MSVHLKTRHQPRTSALVNRSDAVHGLVVLTHTSHVVISSGQAGHARALTTSPGGLRSLKRIVKQCPGSTAACLANDTENTLRSTHLSNLMACSGGDARCSTFVQVPLRRTHVDLNTSGGTIRPGGLGR